LARAASARASSPRRSTQEATKEEFKTRIWLSITPHFDKVELLRSAITHAGWKHNEEKDESILEQILTEALSANKFLLILDDVWSDTAWKDFQVPVATASCTQPGSRVQVTSRKEDAVGGWEPSAATSSVSEN
jgi:hypothetical protein